MTRRRLHSYLSLSEKLFKGQGGKERPGNNLVPMTLKDRRHFVEDKTAMSAVLAVAMLIGVVVLLGVAVSVMIFLLVGDQPQSAPAVGFTPSEADDRWTLTSAPSHIPWEEYEMRVFGNSGTVKVRLNGESGLDGIALSSVPTPLTPPSFPGELAGGSFLDFCSSANETNVNVVLVHIDSQATVYRNTFEFMLQDPLCV